MATLLEVFQIVANEVAGALVLKNKIYAACLIAGDLINSGNDDGAPFSQDAGAHDQRILWSQKVSDGNERIINQMARAVVAANDEFTQAQILGATDSAIQTNVNALVDAMAAGLTSGSIQ